MYEDNIGNPALVYLIRAVLAAGHRDDIHFAHRMALAVAVQDFRIQPGDCI
jgi:hypothetical protein